MYDGIGTIIYYDVPITPTKIEPFFVDDHFEAFVRFEKEPFDLHLKFHPNDSMIEFLINEFQENRGTWDIHEFKSLGIISDFRELRKSPD